MLPAAVSWETFWGDILLVLGSGLALFNFANVGMTVNRLRLMSFSAAVFLAFGAALTMNQEVGTYSAEHPEQALAAFGVLAVAGVCGLARLFAAFAKKVPDGKDMAADEDGAKVSRYKPAGNVVGHQEDLEVEEAENQDTTDNGLVGDPREMSVQRTGETPSDVGQEGWAGGGHAASTVNRLHVADSATPALSAAGFFALPC